VRTLELKVPPVLVVLATALSMWLGAWAVPGLRFPLPGHRAFAVGLAAVGSVVCLVGVAAFKRARTTVNPTTPSASSTLVRSGIYRFTRNPMYLGFGLVLLAWAIFLSNALALCLVPAFVVYMNRYQIQPEERALAHRFGPDFVAYASRVRRWL
jgi:protein-S-isoprenylcysteine O-methyltransferase Ste14